MSATNAEAVDEKERAVSVGSGAEFSELDESWRTAAVEQALCEARAEEEEDPEWTDFGEESDDDTESTSSSASVRKALGLRVRALFYDADCESVPAHTEATFLQREFRTCEQCWEHARERYGMDVCAWQTTLGLDLYDSIRLVNHIRAAVRAQRCFVCDGVSVQSESCSVSGAALSSTFASQAALCAHLQEKKHCSSPEQFAPLVEALRAADELLIPVIPADPLLSSLPDPDIEEEDSDTEELLG
eukprot:CAMPEP_0174246424 /NCGR_PEP_ID=MMETSP0417-20130205/42064_1 /TAXON_ID=242541 /ORGANISM="Mayorella sp, Strain BSH-02190019" /LENGTH=244 /DNA_ID=CAMNT_0015326277 /DNA_START=82 /DNA_END=816 /DNA_ORIENTATION=+